VSAHNGLTIITDITRWCAVVQVPADAFIIDFTFRGSRGAVDDNSKKCYHFPTQGSTTVEQKMHIVNCSVEMAPIAKVGGMGDVVTALSRALQVPPPPPDFRKWARQQERKQ